MATMGTAGEQTPNLDRPSPGPYSQHDQAAHVSPSGEYRSLYPPHAPTTSPSVQAQNVHPAFGAHPPPQSPDYPSKQAYPRYGGYPTPMASVHSVAPSTQVDQPPPPPPYDVGGTPTPTGVLFVPAGPPMAFVTGGHYGNGRPPDTNLGLIISILCIFFFCVWPCGIPAIYYNRKAAEHNRHGQYSDARKALRSMNHWLIAASVTVLVVLIISIVLEGRKISVRIG